MLTYMIIEETNWKTLIGIITAIPILIITLAIDIIFSLLEIPIGLGLLWEHFNDK